MIWPYYVSQGSSKGDLLIAFVFALFFPSSSPSSCTRMDPGEVTAPCGSLTCVWLHVHWREDRESKRERGGESTVSTLTQTCECRGRTGLLDTGQCQHKELCHIPKFYGRNVIFILYAAGIRSLINLILSSFGIKVWAWCILSSRKWSRQNLCSFFPHWFMI